MFQVQKAEKARSDAYIFAGQENLPLDFEVNIIQR